MRNPFVVSTKPTSGTYPNIFPNAEARVGALTARMVNTRANATAQAGLKFFGFICTGLLTSSLRNRFANSGVASGVFNALRTFSSNSGDGFKSFMVTPSGSSTAPAIGTWFSSRRLPACRASPRSQRRSTPPHNASGSGLALRGSNF